jgi:hypothetical protein
MVFDQLGCDARNDAPWKALRHGPALTEEIESLRAALGPLHLTDDEIDGLWDGDATEGQQP